MPAKLTPELRSTRGFSPGPANGTRSAAATSWAAYAPLTLPDCAAPDGALSFLAPRPSGWWFVLPCKLIPAESAIPGLRKALQTSSSQLRNMRDLARPAPQRRSFGRSADRHSRLRKRCVVVCAPSAALGRAEWPASAASGTDADAGDDGRRTRSGATAPGRLARCRCTGRRRRRAAGPLLATTSGGYGAAWCSVFTRSSHERGRCAGDFGAMGSATLLFLHGSAQRSFAQPAACLHVPAKLTPESAKREARKRRANERHAVGCCEELGRAADLAI